MFQAFSHRRCEAYPTDPPLPCSHSHNKQACTKATTRWSAVSGCFLVPAATCNPHRWSPLSSLPTLPHLSPRRAGTCGSPEMAEWALVIITPFPCVARTHRGVIKANRRQHPGRSRGPACAAFSPAPPSAHSPCLVTRPCATLGTVVVCFVGRSRRGASCFFPLTNDASIWPKPLECCGSSDKSPTVGSLPPEKKKAHTHPRQ